MQLSFIVGVSEHEAIFDVSALGDIVVRPTMARVIAENIAGGRVHLIVPVEDVAHYPIGAVLKVTVELFDAPKKGKRANA